MGKDEKILVSVIIPVYNGEQFISQTIDSVFKQDISEIELIIVDDGSTDNTLSIIENRKTDFSSIQILSQCRLGVSNARNAGLALAKGRYIAFLDADDWWLPNNLSCKVDFLLTKNKAGAVTSYCELIDEKNVSLSETKFGDYQIKLDDLLSWKGNYITIPSGILFKKEVFDTIDGFNISLSNNADQELMMRLLFSGFEFYTIEQVTWKYRRHQTNMSSNVSLMERDTLLTYQLAEENKYFKSRWFRNACFSKAYLILALSWMKDGNNFSKGAKYLCQSFLAAPVFFTGEILEKSVSRLKKIT